jgi:RimJ/RimL family protein N-acetyltransferase
VAAQKFTLRPANLDDVVPYTYFLADREVSLWLDDLAQLPLSTGRIEALLMREAWCLWSIDVAGKFAGVTSLYEPNHQTGTARYSIVVGDKTCWGKGVGTGVTASVLDYAFTTLGLRKVNSDYLEPHEGSRQIHKHNGFVEEGRSRADAWREGRWVDRILVSVLRDEWTPPKQ